MGPDLPRSVVDGKPGVCWSDRRFFGVAENSHAIELVYLDRIMAISLNALMTNPAVAAVCSQET
jgi:hypothetical protein